MGANPITCTVATDVQTAARLMQTHRVSSLCVTDAAGLVGIVTTRDLTGKVLALGPPVTTPVEQVMTRPPLTLPPTACCMQ